MEKYIELSTRNTQKLNILQEKLKRQQKIRKAVLEALKTLLKTSGICQLVCTESNKGVAARIATPNILGQTKQSIQDIEKRRTSLQESLTHINLELRDIQQRIQRLESKDYEASIRDAAVQEAKQYVDLVVDSYKKQHEAVHKVLEHHLELLRKKQNITTEDVEDLAEEIEDVTAAVAQPETLLESIRAFQPETLKAVVEQDTSTKENIMSSLMRELAKRREAIQGRNM